MKELGMIVLNLVLTFIAGYVADEEVIMNK